LHAIGDSNAYLSRNNGNIVLTIEHRAAPGPEPMTLELVSDPDKQSTYLRVCDQSSLASNEADPPLGEQVLRLLARQEAGLPRTDMRARLHVNNDRLGKALMKLEGEGLIVRGPDGWRLAS